MSVKINRDVKFLLATKLGWLFILFLGKMKRLKVIGYGYFKKTTESRRGVLAIIWHGRILLPIYMHRNLGVTAMVSLHEDGEMIAQTIHRLGYKTVRGSSTQGSRQAFHQMLRELKKGAICTIMPDGPRGPRHILKEGTIHLASWSGAYILPLTFSAKRYKKMRSWDKFMLWMPFTRLVAMYGKPITIPRNLSNEEVEKYKHIVQSAMIKLEEEADVYFRA